jgi:hypothetical protein
MSNSSWYFKRSFIDPKNGEIRLYYLHIEGKSTVLVTNKSLSEHKFDDLPSDFPLEDALERIKSLQNKPKIDFSFSYKK